jgi:diaminopimelate epimerase
VTSSTGYRFLKGHATENDFLLLPDHDGTVHGELSPSRVRALCDRRAGLGADGVLRVVRAAVAGLGGPDDDAGWFMDYRNADGTAAEMCGNGIRLFGRHLVDEGLVDPAEPIRVGTRDGVKTVLVEGDRITVEMGVPRVLGETSVSVGHRSWPARHVDVGNPHAVAFVDDLAEAGALAEPPLYDATAFPDGVNVEFVVRRGPGELAMRVHERGSGETRSCGTGACAAMVAAASADGPVRPERYLVDVPGGQLHVSWDGAGELRLTGPALVIARGQTTL